MLTHKKARNSQSTLKQTEAAAPQGSYSLEGNELTTLIHRFVGMVTDQLRVAISNQVEAMLAQELGNLARARDTPRGDPRKREIVYSGDRIVRAKEFRFRSGLGKTMFHEIQKKESPYFDVTFPLKVVPRNGGRAVGYKESDVSIWIEKGLRAKE